MKLIFPFILIFLSAYCNSYGQNNGYEYFESLTDHDIKILTSIYQLKSKENNSKYLKSLDSVKISLSKSHKLYPIILILSAEENEKNRKEFV